jgi:hypothetical protein
MGADLNNIVMDYSMIETIRVAGSVRISHIIALVLGLCLDTSVEFNMTEVELIGRVHRWGRSGAGSIVV